MPKKEQDEVQSILDYAYKLEQDAAGPRGSELIAEAVLLCAGKAQDMTAPDSPYFCVIRRILNEFDIGSPEALHRMRGTLRAAAQIDGVNQSLHSTSSARDDHQS